MIALSAAIPYVSLDLLSLSCTFVYHTVLVDSHTELASVSIVCFVFSHLVTFRSAPDMGKAVGSVRRWPVPACVLAVFGEGRVHFGCGVDWVYACFQL